MSFKMSINLGNTQAGGQPSETTRKLASGVYKGKIGKVEGKNANTRAMFVIEVIDDAEMSGLTAVTSMKIPTSRTDGVLYYWRALAESCGYSDEEISGVDAWEDHHFSGKECFFEYQEGDKDKGIYSKVTWLIPSVFEFAKERFESKKSKAAKTEPEKTANKSVQKIDVGENPFADLQVDGLQNMPF